LNSSATQPAQDKIASGDVDPAQVSGAQQ